MQLSEGMRARWVVCVVEVGDLLGTEEYLPGIRKGLIFPPEPEPGKFPGIYNKSPRLHTFVSFPFGFFSLISYPRTFMPLGSTALSSAAADLKFT